jgi:hypothetical protein
MSNNKESHSRFKFLWIDIVFSEDETKWYRILIIILALAATIIIIWKLKEWIAPTIAIEKFSRLKFSEILQFFRSRNL